MFPRRFDHFRATDNNFAQSFTSRHQMVEGAHHLIRTMQKPDYFDDPTIEKWATSYCFASSYYYLSFENRCRILRSESTVMMHGLQCHRINAYSGLGPIEAQLRKKAFWMTLAIYVHTSIREYDWEFMDNQSFMEGIDSDALWPLDVDDEWITHDGVLQQPPGVLSLTTGFIAEKKIVTCLMLTKANARQWANPESPPSDGNNRPIPQPPGTKSRLQMLKFVLDDLPPHLELWRIITAPEQESIRLLQYNVQRASIHLTHLWAQSLLIERIQGRPTRGDGVEGDSQSQKTPEEIHLWEMKEDLCRQLLHLLSTSP